MSPEITAKVAAEREAQGLDPQVIDAAALARIAAVVAQAEENVKPPARAEGLTTILRADTRGRPHQSQSPVRENDCATQ